MAPADAAEQRVVLQGCCSAKQQIYIKRSVLSLIAHVTLGTLRQHELRSSLLPHLTEVRFLPARVVLGAAALKDVHLVVSKAYSQQLYRAQPEFGTLLRS